MKTSLLATLSPLALAAGTAWALPFTYETPTELSTQGDFNGDGRPDLAIFDRDLGTLRVLASISGVSFAGGGSHSLGMDGADSLTSGLLPGGAHGVAVGSSVENRVIAVVPRTASVQEVNFGARSHPGAVVMTGTGTVGGTAAGLLYVNTDYNPPPIPARNTLVGLSAAVVSTGGDGEQGLPSYSTPGLRSGNPVVFGAITALGYIQPGLTGAASTFHLSHDAAGDPRAARSQLAGLPPDAYWAHGDYTSQAGWVAFLFYEREASTFLPREAATAIVGGNVTFTGSAAVSLGAPIHLLMTVEREGRDRLLALLDGGARAVLYDYQVGGAPSVVKTWNAPAGETFTQVAPLDGGAFVLLRGVNGRSTAWSRFDPSGNDQNLTMTGEFCCGLQSRQLATLFYFDTEPFVSASAKLFTTVRERDWADAPVLTGAPIRLFTDQGLRLGLGQPVNYTPTPGQYQHLAIPNQFTRVATGGQAPISLASLANRKGAIAPVITFDPPAGHHLPLQSEVPPPAPGDTNTATAVRDTFTVTLTNPAGSAMQYRTSTAQAWQTYTAPVAFTPAMTTANDVTLLARVTGSAKVFTARYTFGVPVANTSPLTLPAVLDKNNNGLPDDWEAAFAQSNPNADTDGDGRTALQEYLAGTDPRDKFSVTPPASVVASAAFPNTLNITTLTLGNTRLVRLWWPARYSDALLQGSDDMKTWTPISQSIVLDGTDIVHTAPYPNVLNTSTVPRHRYYRLERAAACPCGNP